MEAGQSFVNGAALEVRIPISREPSIAAVRIEHVAHFWPKVADWIGRALAEAVHHELSAQEIYRRCMSGEYLMLLIAIGEQLVGVAVLERSVNAKGQTYVLINCAGGQRMPEWIGLLVSTCRTVAQEVGAVELLMVGRPGWKPFLMTHGAKVKCICMSLEV
jgi:hypothetical protein